MAPAPADGALARGPAAPSAQAGWACSGSAEYGDIELALAPGGGWYFPLATAVNSPRVKLREQVVCGGPVSDQFPAVQENQLLLRPGQQAPARGQRRDLEARALKSIPDVADCDRGRTRCLRHGEIVAAPAAAFAFLTWTPGSRHFMPLG